jgi:hypothetical protein
MNVLLHLHPIQAVQDHWRSSSPAAHFAAGTAGLAAWIASVNWAAVFAVVGVAITTVAGTGMQLYKQWRVIQIELAEAERESRSRTP